MSHSSSIVRQLLSAVLGGSPSPKRRRLRQLTPTVDGLEDRVVLSHIGGFHHHHAHHVASVQTAQTSTATASDTLETTAGTTSMTTSSVLSTARQTLLDDIQTIELASGTTISQLTAIHAARIAWSSRSRTERR